MKNKILVVLSLLLVVAVGFGCMASAEEAFTYKPVFQYLHDYKITWSAGAASGSWLQSFQSSDTYPFYWHGDFSSGVSKFTLGISEQTSTDYIIAFAAGSRVTFKYRIYCSDFAALNQSGLQNWFDFVNKNGTGGSVKHTYNYVSYGNVASSAGADFRDYEVTFDNESAEMLYFTGFRIGVTSYNSNLSFAGYIGCMDLRYHIWTDAEILNSNYTDAINKQTDAINKQTDTVTNGWTQEAVDAPAGSETMDDYSQQESALLDSQQSGLEAGKKSFSDTLNSFLQYQGAFLGVASMIGNFVNVSGGMQFLIYTSMSLGLCGFVIGLGAFLTRATRERENAKIRESRYQAAQQRWQSRRRRGG